MCTELQILFFFLLDTNLVNGSLTSGTRTSGHESRIRPSVDSLLDELNADVPNGQVHNFYMQECEVDETGIGSC